MAKIFALVFPQGVTPPAIARTLACLLLPYPRYSPAIWTEKAAGGEAMDWKHLLASITGTVDQELLEFIPIKSLVAKDSGAPGSYGKHSTVPSRDHGRPASRDGSQGDRTVLKILPPL